MPQSWSKLQRAKGDRLKLTWFAARSCWKKFYRGKVGYFHFANSSAGYTDALTACARWKQEVGGDFPHVADYRYHLEQFAKVHDWYSRFGIPGGEEDTAAKVANYVGRLRSALDGPLHDLPPVTQVLAPLLGGFFWVTERTYDPETQQYSERIISRGSPKGQEWELPELWQERIRQLSTLSDKSKKSPQTVRHWLDEFFAFKADQVSAAEMRIGTLQDLRQRLKSVSEWLKDGTHVSTIDESTVDSLYRHLLRSAIGAATKRNRFSTFKSWLRWLDNQVNADFTLPKNLSSKSFRFTVHLDETGRKRLHKTADLWTVDDFANGLKLADPWPCWLALMLNCGFTQTDLAELRHDEVQLHEGRIVRQRTKTRRTQHPPIVSYKLWPRTLSLLKPHLNRNDDRVFTMPNGTRLIVEMLKESGEPTKYDNVSAAWGNLRKALAKQDPPQMLKKLKFLRKTGSTALRRNPSYTALDMLYLGESLKTIADRYYNVLDGEPFEPLDQALEWLGNEFGMMKG